jgi:phage terminase large subunit
MSTLNDNILIADGFGLLTKYEKYCTLTKDRIGSSYLDVDCGKYGKKKISLCGYSNKKMWKNVLGGSIENMLIDEANIAELQFLLECYARQTSFPNPLTIYTLNGDVPTAPIYDFINPSKIIGDCPASIRAQMDKVDKKQGYYYTHWTMKDNPIMTPQKIADASSLYPPGSFYHTIKILGERGTPGEAIYVDYIDESKILQKIDIAKLHSFIVSMDIGATRAQNSITLLGFTPNYDTVAVVAQESFSQVGYKEKTEKLKAFIRKWKSLGASYIENVIIDSAEQNYIQDLREVFQREGFPAVVGSYKATIKERIDMNIVLLASGKLIFNDTPDGRAALNAFKEATWKEGEIGKERKDENEPWNDKLDSIEYGETRHMKALIRSAKAGKV